MFGATREVLRRLHAIERQRGRLPTPQESGPLASLWGHRLLAELGISLEVRGTPRLEPTLYVSNHTSYLDILVWLAAAPCCFLAKGSVRRAPLLGPGATVLGTVYVDRGSRSSRQSARAAIGRTVGEDGRNVVVFPEGTTHHNGGPWRRGSFEAARDHELVVQPAAVRYSAPKLCAYVDKPFARHFWDVLGSAPISAQIEFLEPRRIDDAARDIEAARLEVCETVAT